MNSLFIAISLFNGVLAIINSYFFLKMARVYSARFSVFVLITIFVSSLSFFQGVMLLLR